METLRKHNEKSDEDKSPDVVVLENFIEVSAILTNAHTCLYKNNVSQYFAIDPPLLKEYFQWRKLCALSTQMTLFKTCNNFNSREN